MQVRPFTNPIVLRNTSTTDMADIQAGGQVTAWQCNLQVRRPFGIRVTWPALPEQSEVVSMHESGQDAQASPKKCKLVGPESRNENDHPSHGQIIWLKASKVGAASECMPASVAHQQPELMCSSSC